MFKSFTSFVFSRRDTTIPEEEEEFPLECSYTEIAQSFDKEVQVICLDFSRDSKQHKSFLEQIQDLYHLNEANTTI